MTLTYATLTDNIPAACLTQYRSGEIIAGYNPVTVSNAGRGAMLQEAIEEEHDSGDAWFLAPTTYRLDQGGINTVTLTAANITLIGASAGTTTIDTNSGGSVEGPTFTGTCEFIGINFAHTTGNECFMTSAGAAGSNVLVCRDCRFSYAVWFRAGTDVKFFDCRFDSSIALDPSNAAVTAYLEGCQQYYNNTSAALVVVSGGATATLTAMGSYFEHSGTNNTGFISNAGSGTQVFNFENSRFNVTVPNTAAAIGPTTKASGSITVNANACTIIAHSTGKGVLANSRATVNLTGGRTYGPAAGGSTYVLQQTGVASAINVGYHTYDHSNINGTITDLNA